MSSFHGQLWFNMTRHVHIFTLSSILYHIAKSIIIVTMLLYTDVYPICDEQVHWAFYYIIRYIGFLNSILLVCKRFMHKYVIPSSYALCTADFLFFARCYICIEYLTHLTPFFQHLKVFLVEFSWISHFVKIILLCFSVQLIIVLLSDIAPAAANTCAAMYTVGKERRKYKRALNAIVGY